MSGYATMHPPELWRFTGGAQGPWTVDSITTIAGESLAAAQRLDITRAAPGSSNRGAPDPAPRAAWSLAGITSNRRYATRAEVEAMSARPAPLARPQATCAALIPIRKSATWWALAQDERRAIFEEQAHHTAIGLKAMPQVARQLHHGRDLGEPFDFLTWFEFAPEHSAMFDEMVHALRESSEWAFVEREVDIRLTRAG